jgi:hypothetical protein
MLMWLENKNDAGDDFDEYDEYVIRLCNICCQLSRLHMKSVYNE